MSKQALSSRGVCVEYVGVDTSEIIRRVAKRMVERDEKQRQRLREEEFRWKYDAKETYYCVMRLVSGVDGTPSAVYEVSTIQPVGKGVVKVRGRQFELRAELRMELARTYLHEKLCKDWDECRARAAKAEIAFDMVPA